MKTTIIRSHVTEPKQQRFQGATRRDAERAARHEFGHWLSAKRAGFETHGISLTMIGYYDHYKGHVEMTLQEDLRSVDSITDYARRRIMVLLSGAMSEWLKEGKVDEGYAQRELQPGGRAVNDMKGVSELVRIIRNATYSVSQDAEEHQKQLDDIYKPIWRETVAFIEAEHELITNMGLSISERGQILERTLWNVRAGITCDRSYPSMASSASDAASLDFDRLACIVRDITKALRHGRVCPDVTSQDTAAPM